jgi:photosystem II stability/assembly factor-like uncharacterized protein
MNTRNKTNRPTFVRKLSFQISILISLTLLAVFVAYRYQQSSPTCGDQFAAAPERFSQQWWTCPRELNRHARVIGNIGNEDLVRMKLSGDGLRGWALTKTGTLVATQDAGLNWIVLGRVGNGSDFTDLFFNEDGLHGWVLGGLSRGLSDDGRTEIFSTVDGGKTWKIYSAENAKSLLNQKSYRMQFASDEKRAWIIGENNTILHTQNAGNIWERQYPLTENKYGNPLYDIVFDHEGMRGWVVGSGSLLKTIDGGKHWEVINLLLEPKIEVGSLSLRSVHMTKNAQHIWLAGENIILHSSNAGVSWTKQQSPKPSVFTNIHFSDDGLSGWASSDASLFYYLLITTSDSGKNWHEQARPANVAISQIATIADGRQAIMIGQQGTILTSKDGGAKWITQASQASLNISDLSINNSRNQAWFVSDRGIWRSLNGGETWNIVLADAYRDRTHSDFPSRINFDVNGKIGVALGDWSAQGSYLARTQDGGENWQKFSPEPMPDPLKREQDYAPFEARGLLMSTDAKHILIHDGLTVYLSEDSGLSWRKEKWYETKEEFENKFCVASYEIVLNEYVGIWSEITALKTRPTCHWKEKNQVLISGQAPASYLPSINQVIHKVNAKNKDGAPWQIHPNNDKLPMRSMRFTQDRQYGIAIGSRGEIIVSEDRGEHWREYAVPTTSRLNTVRYSSDEKQAWAVGEHNAIFMSKDNGKTWQAKGQYQRLPPPWFYAFCLGLGLMCLILVMYKILKHVGAKHKMSK